MLWVCSKGSRGRCETFCGENALYILDPQAYFGPLSKNALREAFTHMAINLLNGHQPNGIRGVGNLKAGRGSPCSTNS